MLLSSLDFNDGSFMTRFYCKLALIDFYNVKIRSNDLHLYVHGLQNSPRIVKNVNQVKSYDNIVESYTLNIN